MVLSTYNWYIWAAGLASVLQFNNIVEPRNTVVLVGVVVRAVPVGWSNGQRQQNKLLKIPRPGYEMPGNYLLLRDL